MRGELDTALSVLYNNDGDFVPAIIQIEQMEEKT